MLYLLLSNILCFIWPLFLTFKLLNGAHHKRRTIDDRNSEQVKFLLNYWICFIAVDYIERLVLYNSLFWPLLGFGYLPDVVSSTVKFWLFYNHGCLVINYCYLDLLLKKINCVVGSVNTMEDLELKFINSAMKTLFSENYLGPLKLLSSKTRSQILRRVVQFSEGFAKSDKSFLQFSLDNICYMDSDQDLERNFEITNKFIGSVMSFLQHQLILLKFQEQSVAPIPSIFQFSLIPNIRKDGSQNTLKFKSFDDRFEPIPTDINYAKANNTPMKELEYNSRNDDVGQKHSFNRKLIPKYIENYRSATYTKRKLKRSSSKSKYLDNTICDYIPLTISNPFQLGKYK
mmetsp:Transcript_7615/g.9432  ORF Transcript_7615/g.9432 Transcript_7615/m.9432 type:complete len:344 (-) Transcript_7615:18-1049(-)